MGIRDTVYYNITYYFRMSIKTSHIRRREYLQPTKVSEIIKPVGTGICEPFYAKIEDVNIVLKTYNNVESNRVLANELICFKLAKELSLPIPEAGVCVVDQSTIIDNVYFNHQCFGLGFYSTRINKVTKAVLTPKIIQNFISNKEDIYRVILFDHLICNKDRHKGNFLLNIGKEKRLYIIDHSHAFSLGAVWDEFQLQRLIEEKDHQEKEVLLKNKEGYKAFFESLTMDLEILSDITSEFKTKLSYERLQLIVYSIPDEWGISNNEKDKLIEYLLYRLNKLKDMCINIADHSY